MYEKLEVCPICKHTNFTNYLISTDNSITGESFALVKCTKCELVFTNPRPNEENLPKYYDADDYISHSNKPNNLINFIYKIVRNYTISRKVSLVKKYTSGKAILDYGCGTGEFLQSCQKQGFNSYGFEPSSSASRQAEEKNITLVKDLKKLKEKVDVITAWHVIEHVSELKKTIKILQKKLNNDGVMLIAVPNLNSLDSQIYGEYWAALDVPRHLYHFTQETFGKLIAKTKLTLVETIPMHFDSYYVSMLSEKYMSPKGNIFNAIKNGYKSNSNARRTGEYSSLIYVLKK